MSAEKIPYLFQLVRQATGERSEPMTASFEQMAQLCIGGVANGVNPDDLILILCPAKIDDNWTGFSKAPMIAVRTFIETFYNPAPGAVFEGDNK